jgi:hypothetical protein
MNKDLISKAAKTRPPVVQVKESEAKPRLSKEQIERRKVAVAKFMARNVG